MTRLVVLRAGYAAVGLAFLALATSIVSPALVLPALGVALLAGILLAFSGEDLPKWAGLALVGYFVLSVLAFLAATPVTISRGGDGYFVNPAPPALAGEVLYWMGLLSPMIVGAAAVLAVWERERPPRYLLMGAVGGFLLVALLNIILVPRGDALSAIEAARSQARILETLFGASAVVGAIGAGWATVRADEDGV